MAVPRETIWEIEPHTQAKHEILRRYLGAWFPILNRYHSRIVYIDGFSGPGRYKGGEPGSPLVALEVARTHRTTLQGELTFIFIDERSDRVAHLTQELAAISIPTHFSVVAETGVFHEKLSGILDGLEADDRRLAPAFAFIDPFGFKGIPFSLVDRLLRRPNTEAFITFMVDPINRFIEHPNAKVAGHIADIFGSPEVLDAARGPGDRAESLRMLYQRRLQSVAKFVRYFEMRDRDDRIIYYLFFATNHRLGDIKMKEAFWKVDPDGRFRFSDATNPNQLVMFQSDPSLTLTGTLHQMYRSQTVPVEQVKRFVEDNTPFLAKHLGSALKILETNGEITVERLKRDGKIRRANTFPDDVIVTFSRAS